MSAQRVQPSTREIYPLKWAMMKLIYGPDGNGEPYGIFKFSSKEIAGETVNTKVMKMILNIGTILIIIL